MTHQGQGKSVDLMRAYKKEFTNDSPTRSSHSRQDSNSHPCGSISLILTTWINLLLILKYNPEPQFQLQHQCFWAQCSFIYAKFTAMSNITAEQRPRFKTQQHTGILYVQSFSFLKKKKKSKMETNKGVNLIEWNLFLTILSSVSFSYNKMSFPKRPEATFRCCAGFKGNFTIWASQKEHTQRFETIVLLITYIV